MEIGWCENTYKDDIRKPKGRGKAEKKVRILCQIQDELLQHKELDKKVKRY